MHTQCLNGEWTLYYGPEGATPDNFGKVVTMGADYRKCQHGALAEVTAAVPGNVELDLCKAGLLPEDIYFGENILEAEKFEHHEWIYVRDFEAEKVCTPAQLVFEGVDCLAEYYLNGQLVGQSANALVPIVINVTGVLCEGKNTVAVRILSIRETVQNSEYNTFLASCGFGLNLESVYIRKPPHAFGWDIMPRAVTAGLWRGVSLQTGKRDDFKELAIHVGLQKDKAVLKVCYDSDMPYQKGTNFAQMHIKGVCGDSCFEGTQNVHFKAGFATFEVKNPKLWWPYGYGEPNLYDITLTLTVDGETVATQKLRYGIRTVELERTEHVDKPNVFQFIINSVPVMVKGSNWVPLDAYHSRDKARLKPAIDLMSDIGCNMIRCWGGNVYECDEFYDLCDERGMMVWQDFTMACHPYPQDETFMKNLAAEAAVVVRRLRNHCCVALWSGDNENDMMMWNAWSNPDHNLLTRNVLPEVIKLHDANRPYLPSSPYVTGAQFKAGAYAFIGEDHLWGPRDYFKSGYYMRSLAAFTSEIGYHGMPSVESLRKYISEENLNNINHPEWVLHSADQKKNNARINLVPRQVKQLFGVVPEALEDLVLASQISQAEAKKFFIEHMRLGRPARAGILWWNLIDGWPQISDAVVDYYYDKKLAYDYIKVSQAPFAIMADELSDWYQPIVAGNDSMQTVTGTYTVCDGETGEQIVAGEFTAAPNSNTPLVRLSIMYSEHKLLIMEWDTNIGKGRNHYLCGLPPIDFARYKKWLPVILGK